MSDDVAERLRKLVDEIESDLDDDPDRMADAPEAVPETIGKGDHEVIDYEDAGLGAWLIMDSAYDVWLVSNNSLAGNNPSGMTQIDLLQSALDELESRHTEEDNE